MNREDFPALHQEVHGKPLAFLDNAASTQKPRAVIDAMKSLYEKDYANVHRGLHTLSERSTAAYEGAREKLARFINAPHTHEVIFTRNATEGMNLVAHGYARKFLKPGDTVLLTEMEHHSNLVPWHMLKAQHGVELRFIPVLPDGTLDLSDLDALLDGVKLVSVVHASNVLGTINPIARIAEAAHTAGAVMLVDGAQSTPNMPIDVAELGVDFFALSGHKMVGPSGIGVLWGKSELLEAMDPFLGGGDMIEEVYFDRSTYAELPNKFEAGTPAIAEAVGIGAAADYLSGIGMDKIYAAERAITDYALNAMLQVEGLRVFGNAPERTGAITFTLEGVHPHDLATIVDGYGVAIRAGHHCAQPLHRKFGLHSSARASLYFYNNEADVAALVTALEGAKELFGVL